MMETNRNQQQSEGRNAEVFRKLIEIQILLNGCLSSLDSYDKEVKKIIQSIDDLLDQMLETQVDLQVRRWNRSRYHNYPTFCPCTIAFLFAGSSANLCRINN